MKVPHVAFVLVVALGLVSSCRPRDESEQVLRFWAFGREGEVVSVLVRDFEREHPGVKVRVQQIPWSAAHEKLLTAHVGRASPDVAQMGNTWIPEMVTLDAIEPLDTWRARSAETDSSSHFPGIWATNVIDGVLYGVPWYVDTRVLFYRSDILARAGYKRMPDSWPEWLEAMRAIKRNATAGQFAIFLPTNEWPPQAILGLQQGSPLLTSHGHGAFADAPFRRAFDFMLALYREGLAAPITNNEIANVHQEFGRGTFAIWITGPWNLGELRRRLPVELRDAWATAPMPGPTGPASGVSLAGGSSLVLFRSSKQKKLAWQLVEFLSRPEQQVRFYRLTGDLPARREAWADSSLAGDPYAAAFREQLGRVVPTPMVPEWEQVTVKLMNHTEAAVQGTEGPAEALTALDADVDRVLERRRFLLARRQVHGDSL